MPDYRLFGGILRSDIPFPELRPAAGTPTWRLRRGAVADGVEHLGEDVVTADANVTLQRTPNGFRLTYDDTGAFEVSADGGTVTWSAGRDTDPAATRTDVTGRVLALAQHAMGRFCLHAAAVTMSDRAVGFLAPKQHGKSTLSLALVQAGARLLSDDTLPIDPGPPPRAWPGLHSARLWPDTALRLAPGEPRGVLGGKVVFDALTEDRVSHEDHALEALYLLAPRAPDARPERHALGAREAAVGLLANAKLGPLLGASEAPVLFRRATAVAAAVPVYRLHVPRSLDRLPDVVAAVRGWHGEAPA